IVFAQELAKLKAEFEAVYKEVREKAGELKGVNTLFDAFAASLVKVNEASALAPLANIIRGERTQDLLSADGVWILYLKSVHVGGEVRTRRNLITGSKLDYSGAAIVNYILFDRQGTVRAGRPVYSLTP